MRKTLLRNGGTTLLLAMLGAGWLLPGSCLAQKASLDPARLAAAREMMAAQGGSAQAQKGLDQMRAAMIADVARRNPGETEAFTRFMERYMGKDSPRLKRYIDQALEAIVGFYAERCTVEELKAMAAFLASPTGRKFVSIAPEAGSAIVPHLMQFQNDMISDIRAAAERGEFKLKP